MENAQELMEEFEKEYSRDNGKVKRQEKIEEDRDYWRGSFPGKFAATTLFGWSNRRYNREYWDCIDRNWRKWNGKGTRPLKQRRLKPIMEVREEEEYQGRRIEEWNEEDEMGKIRDIMGEL